MAAPPVPRIDKAPLTKRFPFLGNFERCSWIAGVAYDGSKGRVPSPSEYFIRAYVVLDREQTKALLDQYQWAQSSSDQIPSPAYQLGEGFPNIEGPSLEVRCFDEKSAVDHVVQRWYDSSSTREKPAIP